MCNLKASTSTKIAQKINLSSFHKKRVEFIKMKGPGVNKKCDCHVSSCIILKQVYFFKGKRIRSDGS
jgi:hypothetical protein